MSAPRPSMENKQQKSIKLSDAITWKLSIVESWIYHHLVPKFYIFCALCEQSGFFDTLTALLDMDVDFEAAPLGPLFVNARTTLKLKVL